MKRTALAVVLALFSACGGGVSDDDQLRSIREYELGVGLMNEGSAPTAFEHLLIAIQLDPLNAEAHNVLGVLFTARHDFAKASEHLTRALTIAESGEIDARPSLKAEIRNNIGVLHIEEGHYQEAITVLREATSDLLYTTPYLGWANLGLAYYKLEEYQQAIAALEQAVRLQRDFCLGHLRLGQTYVALRDFERAEASLTRVVEVDNVTCQRTQEAWRLRGEARAQLGHRQDATTDFERCVELGSDSDAGQACRRMLGAMH